MTIFLSQTGIASPSSATLKSGMCVYSVIFIAAKFLYDQILVPIMQAMQHPHHSTTPFSYPQGKKGKEKEKGKRRKGDLEKGKERKLEEQRKDKGNVHSQVTPHSTAATPQPPPPSNAGILGFKAYHFDLSST